MSDDLADLSTEKEAGDATAFQAGLAPFLASASAQAKELSEAQRRQQQKVFEDFIKNATALKAHGNELFKAGQWDRALQAYFSALASFSSRTAEAKSSAEVRRMLAVLYSNCSACCLHLAGRQDDAVQYANAATEVDPSFGKGWFRKASALQRGHQYDAALATLKSLLRGIKFQRIEGVPKSSVLKKIRQIQKKNSAAQLPSVVAAAEADANSHPPALPMPAGASDAGVAVALPSAVTVLSDDAIVGLEPPFPSTFRPSHDAEQSSAVETAIKPISGRGWECAQLSPSESSHAMHQSMTQLWLRTVQFAHDELVRQTQESTSTADIDRTTDHRSSLGHALLRMSSFVFFFLRDGRSFGVRYRAHNIRCDFNGLRREVQTMLAAFVSRTRADAITTDATGQKDILLEQVVAVAAVCPLDIVGRDDAADDIRRAIVIPARVLREKEPDDVSRRAPTSITRAVCWPIPELAADDKNGSTSVEADPISACRNFADICAPCEVNIPAHILDIFLKGVWA